MWHPIFFFSFWAWWHDVFNLVERKYIGNERQMLQVLWITCLFALQPTQHSSEMPANLFYPLTIITPCVYVPKCSAGAPILKDPFAVAVTK